MKQLLNCWNDNLTEQSMKKQTNKQQRKTEKSLAKQFLCCCCWIEAAAPSLALVSLCVCVYSCEWKIHCVYVCAYTTYDFYFFFCCVSMHLIKVYPNFQPLSELSRACYTCTNAWVCCFSIYCCCCCCFSCLSFIHYFAPLISVSLSPSRPSLSLSLSFCRFSFRRDINFMFYSLIGFENSSATL